MICLKAHAKINWTLNILGTRMDGYHLMDMLMQSIEMHDTLWLEESDTLTLESADGAAEVSGGREDSMASAAVTFDQSNLVYRAAKKLQEIYDVEAGARMRLQKRIPSGAGLGGGSADAAAALLGLNELWGLGLSLDELRWIGVKLGADIPFMLTGGLARVGGIGEMITPLSPAPEIWLVMLQPCSGLSTKEVFTAFDALVPSSLSRPRTDDAQEALLRSDPVALGKAMDNVLEGVSIAVRPAIRAAAIELERLGAARAMMTGSGSVVYGFFATETDALQAAEGLRSLAAQNGWGDVWVTRTLA